VPSSQFNNLLSLATNTEHQQRIPVPIAINVPNVPPPCIIAFPTVFTSSRPRKPYLHRPHKQCNLQWQNTAYSSFNFCNYQYHNCCKGILQPRVCAGFSLMEWLYAKIKMKTKWWWSCLF